jgi:hypothetical protein
LLKWWYWFTGRPIVVLSDGFPVVVRRLGLYELDKVPYDDPGPFLYPYKTLAGKIIERAYDLSQWTEPPKPPKIPEHECAEDSMEAALWHAYNTYQAAVAHRLKQLKAGDEWVHRVSLYVLKNCVDSTRVIEEEDFVAVYQAAINPEISLEEVESVLDDMFPGLLQERERVENALESTFGGALESRCNEIVGRGGASDNGPQSNTVG